MTTLGQLFELKIHARGQTYDDKTEKWSVDDRNYMFKTNNRKRAISAGLRKIQKEFPKHKEHSAEINEAMFRPSLHHGSTGEDDGNRYKVIRFHKNGSRVTLARGLTLGQARHHTQQSETSSSTAKGRAARRYTRNHGDWFDGYTNQ